MVGQIGPLQSVSRANLLNSNLDSRALIFPLSTPEFKISKPRLVTEEKISCFGLVRKCRIRTQLRRQQCSALVASSWNMARILFFAPFGRLYPTQHLLRSRSIASQTSPHHLVGDSIPLRTYLQPPMIIQPLPLVPAILPQSPTIYTLRELRVPFLLSEASLES